MNKTQEIRNYLARIDPLSVTTSKDVFKFLAPMISDLKYHSVREAIQRMSFGSPTSKRHNTDILYAIYLELSELKDATGKSDVYLALPGIERSFIEKMSSGKIERIQQQLYDHYGEATIKFWVHRAQLNSGVSQKVKDKVKQRDGGQCRICTAVENAYISASLAPPDETHTGKLEVSHIISRRSIFWQLLESVDHKHSTIFSDPAVIELTGHIKQNNLFSQAEYLVYLCKRHDGIVQKVLKA